MQKVTLMLLGFHKCRFHQFNNSKITLKLVALKEWPQKTQQTVNLLDHMQFFKFL